MRVWCKNGSEDIWKRSSLERLEQKRIKAGAMNIEMGAYVRMQNHLKNWALLRISFQLARRQLQGGSVDKLEWLVWRASTNYEMELEVNIIVISQTPTVTSNSAQSRPLRTVSSKVQTRATVAITEWTWNGQVGTCSYGVLVQTFSYPKPNIRTRLHQGCTVT